MLNLKSLSINFKKWSLCGVLFFVAVTVASSVTSVMAAEPAKDHIKLQFKGAVNYSIDGNLQYGDIKVSRNGKQVVSVNGTGTITGKGGKHAQVTISIQKQSPKHRYKGTFRVVDTAAHLDVTTSVNRRSWVRSFGDTGAKGQISDRLPGNDRHHRRAYKLRWAVTDRYAQPSADTTAPAWPNGSQLEATDITPTGISLGWAEATDNVGVTRYRLSMNSWTVDLDPETTSYVMGGLSPSTEYEFSLIAMDAAGNKSVASTGKFTTSADTTAPTWPDGGALVVSEVKTTSVKLLWPSASDNSRVSGYRITANGQTIDVASTESAYTVNGLTASTDYEFSIVALDAAGNNSPPLTVTARTNAQTIQTTTELIDAAVARGDIDKGTGVVYKVYAEYGDNRLPSQYAGVSDETSDAISTALLEETSLSAEQQALLAPFLLPAYYSDSWYYLPSVTGKAAAVRASAASAAQATGGLTCKALTPGHTLTTDWDRKVVVAQGQVFNVWYDKTNHPEDSAQAQTIADNIPAIMSTLVTKVGMNAPLNDKGSADPCTGPDTGVDILVSTTSSSYTGKTTPYAYDKAAGNPVFLNIRRGASGDKLDAALAHELMHACQFAQILKPDFIWWMEATAEWAVGAAYPSNAYRNSEYTSERILKTATDQSNKTVEYQIYTLPFFLVGEYSDPVSSASDPRMLHAIGDIWKKLNATTGVFAAIDAWDESETLSETWAQYALRFWNVGNKGDKTKWWDGLSEAASIGAANSTSTINVDLGSEPSTGNLFQSSGTDYTVEPLAANYYVFDIGNENLARGMEIFLDDYYSLPEGVKLNLVFERSDGTVTGPKEITQEKTGFCRDDASTGFPADVKRVLMTVSNSTTNKLTINDNYIDIKFNRGCAYPLTYSGPGHYEKQYKGAAVQRYEKPDGTMTSGGTLTLTETIDFQATYEYFDDGTLTLNYGSYQSSSPSYAFKSTTGQYHAEGTWTDGQTTCTINVATTLTLPVGGASSFQFGWYNKTSVVAEPSWPADGDTFPITQCNDEVRLPFTPTGSGDYCVTDDCPSPDYNIPVSTILPETLSNSITMESDTVTTKWSWTLTGQGLAPPAIPIWTAPVSP